MGGLSGPSPDTSHPRRHDAQQGVVLEPQQGLAIGRAHEGGKLLAIDLAARIIQQIIIDGRQAGLPT